MARLLRTATKAWHTAICRQAGQTEMSSPATTLYGLIPHGEKCGSVDSLDANYNNSCMMLQAAEQLAEKHCTACEGGVEKYTPAQAAELLVALSGWHLTGDGLRIRKDWQVKNFLAGIEFFTRVAELAEAEGHHPDLHLEGYRHVWIELWTHAVGGLSENDFILAAKIDRLPIRLRAT